jgi:hypothetical protein
MGWGLYHREFFPKREATLVVVFLFAAVTARHRGAFV